MKKILMFVTFLVMAAACTAPPPPTPAPSSNANSATAKAPAVISEAEATAREKAVWEALKKKDYEAFGNMLTSDYIEIGGLGVFDKPGIIAYLKDLTVSDVTFADWKLLAIDKDALILTYNVTITGKYKDKVIPPGPYRAGSAWVNRDGKWLAIYYQETLAIKAPPPAPPAAKSGTSPAAATTTVTGPDAIANEKAVWDAFKGKNFDTFAAMLSPDFIEVEANGVFYKAASVNGVRMYDASKAQLSEWKTVKIDSDAALVTYLLTDAKPPQERHTSIWANRDGKWLAIYHQGTPVEAQAAPAKPAASTK